jgi:hypothetical protein
MRILRIDPLSVGKIAAIVYAVLGLIYGVIWALFMGLVVAVGSGSDSAHAGSPAIFGIVMAVVFIVFVPICGGIFGFIGGVLSAAVYNVAARYVGGIEIETDAGTMGAGYPPATSQYQPYAPSPPPPPYPAPPPRFQFQTPDPIQRPEMPRSQPIDLSQSASPQQPAEPQEQPEQQRNTAPTPPSEENRPE